jgi:LEA14-like dessication related protein
MKKIYVLFLLLNVFFITACNQLQIPVYKRMDNFRFDAFSFKQIVFKSDLVMFNPNKIGIELLETETDIYINDIKLGHSAQNKAIRVNKKSEFTIPLTVQLATNQLSFSFIKSLWQSMRKGKVKLHVIGSCRLRKAGIPINFPINYSDNIELKVPDIF